MRERFTPLGYKREYYVKDKYVGIIPLPECVTEDWAQRNRPLGYASRTEFTAKDDFKVGKKTIRKGTRYWVMDLPTCGKMHWDK
jgi:hypothetical protein